MSLSWWPSVTLGVLKDQQLHRMCVYAVYKGITIILQWTFQYNWHTPARTRTRTHTWLCPCKWYQANDKLLSSQPARTKPVNKCSHMGISFCGKISLCVISDLFQAAKAPNALKGEQHGWLQQKLPNNNSKPSLMEPLSHVMAVLTSELILTKKWKRNTVITKTET